MSTTMLGTKVSMPFYVTATALGKLGNPEGEVVLTRGAKKHNVIQMIPTLASCSFDEIMDAAEGDQVQWLQLYVCRIFLFTTMSSTNNNIHRSTRTERSPSASSSTPRSAAARVSSSLLTPLNSAAAKKTCVLSSQTLAATSKAPVATTSTVVKVLLAPSPPSSTHRCPGKTFLGSKVSPRCPFCLRVYKESRMSSELLLPVSMVSYSVIMEGVR